MGKIVESGMIEFEKRPMAPDLLVVPSPRYWYKDLDIQRRAYRRRGEHEKALIPYDKSLQRIRKRGYDRHLRPNEEYSMIFAGLEGKLDGVHQRIFIDMRSSYSEWVNMALEREGNTINAYFDPEGLVWNPVTELYEKRDFTYRYRLEFVADYINEKGKVMLTSIDPDVILAIYGRPLEQFPQALREDAALHSPPEGIIRPAIRIVGNHMDSMRRGAASRGVRISHGKDC